MPKEVEINEEWLIRIAEQVEGMKYGQVTITVHDGRIVQIDRTERTRYDQHAKKESKAETHLQQQPLASR